MHESTIKLMSTPVSTLPTLINEHINEYLYGAYNVSTKDFKNLVNLHRIRNIYYDDVLPAAYLIPCLKVMAENYSTQHELYKTIVDNITMPTKAQMLLES